MGVNNSYKTFYLFAAECHTHKFKLNVSKENVAESHHNL